MAQAAPSAAPHPDWTPPLQALWHAVRGDWDAAHAIAQELDTPAGSWIHAHLHRQEGDLANAGYWYAHAGKPASKLPIAAERTELIRHFLQS